MACIRALQETDDSPVKLREYEPLTEENSIRTFECPVCGFPICEWCDCPECGWIDDEVWEATAGYHGLDA